MRIHKEVVWRLDDVEPKDEEMLLNLGWVKELSEFNEYHWYTYDAGVVEKTDVKL